MQTVKRMKPVGTLRRLAIASLIGLGSLGLMACGSGDEDGVPDFSAAGEAIDEAAESAREAFGDATDKARDALGQAEEEVGRAAEEWQE